MSKVLPMPQRALPVMPVIDAVKERIFHAWWRRGVLIKGLARTYGMRVAHVELILLEMVQRRLSPPASQQRAPQAERLAA